MGLGQRVDVLERDRVEVMDVGVNLLVEDMWELWNGGSVGNSDVAMMRNSQRGILVLFRHNKDTYNDIHIQRSL